MNNNLCRTCYEEIGTIDIFDKTLVIPISKKIMYCCKNINIHEDDGLPVLVCSHCEKELSHLYQFVLKCEAADEKLRSLDDISRCHDLKLEVKVEEIITNEFGDNTINFIPSATKLDTGDIKIEQPEVTPNIKKKLTTKKKCKRKVKGPQKCKECGKKCTNNSTLMIHMRTHSDDRPHACESCDKRYKDDVGLKRHKERNHNEERTRQFICESCGKAFFTKYEVKTHMLTHTGERPYSCRFCPSKFTQAGTLMRHQLRHTGEKPYNCTKCNKNFQTKLDLKRHQVAHSDEKKFFCTTCNSPFKYSSNLRKHLLQHIQPVRFICNYCGRTFNTKGSLITHINAVHSGKSGFCDLCSRDVSNIEVHMWKHTGKRPFKCGLCQSSFFEKKALTRHMNFKHKYTDKYKCSVEGCTGTFPSQQMLQYHVAKFHGSSVPFPCELCPKGFYRKTDLARHKLRFHAQT